MGICSEQVTKSEQGMVHVTSSVPIKFRLGVNIKRSSKARLLLFMDRDNTGAKGFSRKIQ